VFGVRRGAWQRVWGAGGRALRRSEIHSFNWRADGMAGTLEPDRAAAEPKSVA